ALDRLRPPSSLLRAGRPIIAAGLELALDSELGNLLEVSGSAVIIAETPRGERRDPCRLACPLAARALPPGVGDTSRVEVQAEHIINERDTLARLGPR